MARAAGVAGQRAGQKFPLHLLSVQPADRLHSQLDATANVQNNKTAGHETLWMHPQDAAARGISHGDEIEVFNERGSMLAGVQLNDGLTPGVVVTSTGARFDPGFGQEWQPRDRAGNPNVLTLDIGTSSLTGDRTPCPARWRYAAGKHCKIADKSHSWLHFAGNCCE